MTPGPTDAELLAASSSDAHAFRLLYERHAARVDGFFRRRTGSADDALDLTAETFAQAWLSRGCFEDRFTGDAGRWLFGIARNVLRRSVRRAAIDARARHRLGVSVARPDVTAPESWLVGLDADLEQAIAGVPDDQWKAIRLRVVEGRGYDEVGAELGCSPTAARIKVSRGLGRLRRRLEDRTEGGTDG